MYNLCCLFRVLSCSCDGCNVKQIPVNVRQHKVAGTTIIKLISHKQIKAKVSQLSSKIAKVQI